MVDLGPVTPWFPMFDPWPLPPGIVRITALRNEVTGEWMPNDAWIHADDLDWLCRSWQQVFEIEWKVRQAARGAQYAPPGSTP